MAPEIGKGSSASNPTSHDGALSRPCRDRRALPERRVTSTLRQPASSQPTGDRREPSRATSVRQRERPRCA